ncbi:MAG TPA: valine--tRNA ligase, partial [Thiomicrospira sp.]|nr:valine--tRNA ligase [Thiomicrospira sp.]
AKLESIEILENMDNAVESAIALVGEMNILIPMAGLIDKKAELERLQKELTKLEGEIKRFTSKLANESFVSRAPAAVVKKEQQKLSETKIALKNIKDQYEKISQM